jgi:hypothetical protein
MLRRATRSNPDGEIDVSNQREPQIEMNASKTESMLATTISTLTGVGVAIAFGSTRYFTAMQNVGPSGEVGRCAS